MCHESVVVTPGLPPMLHATHDGGLRRHQSVQSVNECGIAPCLPVELIVIGLR